MLWHYRFFNEKCKTSEDSTTMLSVSVKIAFLVLSQVRLQMFYKHERNTLG